MQRPVAPVTEIPQQLCVGQLQRLLQEGRDVKPPAADSGSDSFVFLEVL